MEKLHDNVHSHFNTLIEINYFNVVIDYRTNPIKIKELLFVKNCRF